jgi:hypothetical protein
MILSKVVRISSLFGVDYRSNNLSSLLKWELDPITIYWGTF